MNWAILLFDVQLTCHANFTFQLGFGIYIQQLSGQEEIKYQDGIY